MRVNVRFIMPESHLDKMMDKPGTDSNLMDILAKSTLGLLGNLLVSKVMVQRLGRMDQVTSLLGTSGKVLLPTTSMKFLPDEALATPSAATEKDL